MNNYPDHQSKRVPLMVMPNGQVIYETRPPSDYSQRQPAIEAVLRWGVKRIGMLLLVKAARLAQLHRCAHCPIRCQAAAKPHSLFAQLHRWHTTWWPGWKSYLAEQNVHPAGAASRA